MKSLPAFLAFSVSLTCPLFAGENEWGDKNPTAKAPLDTEWGGPILGAGFKSNDQFSEASFFSLIPWVNTIGDGGGMDGSVFFLEPYGTWAEEGEWGGSLGLGFRHLFSNQSVSDALSGQRAGLLTEGVFVGANLFVDYAESPLGNDYWQTGAGIEVGTRYLEFRSNYYHPYEDAQVVGSRSVTNVSRRSDTTSKTYVSPPAGGTQTTTRVNTTTTRTTTRTNTFDFYEEALEGWDTEVAFLVPGVDQFMDLTLIGGYYNYSGDRISSDIDGLRAGVEVRPVPAVVFHATWFEDEGLYDENWLAGIRFEIPLDRKAAKNAFKPRRRHLAERLFQPVRRKNTAVTFGGGEQSVGTTTTTRSHTDVDRSTSSVDVPMSLPSDMEEPMP